MGLTSKQRQQRFRDKLKQDPERYEQFKEKMRKRYHEDKKVGKVKLINDKSTRAQRSQRRSWRQSKQKERIRRKDLENELTPPPSPSTPVEAERLQPSRQRQQNTRERNRQQAKCYRDKSTLEVKLEMEQKKVDKFRKRIQRMKDVSSKDSPRSKTKKLLRHLTGNNKALKNVRRFLEIHYALLNQLKSKYKLTENRKKVSTAIIGSIMRKYKALSYMRREVGITNPTKNNKKKGTKIKRLRLNVQQFFERDDNSRITTGVRQTVTRLKDKRQKRLLLDTIENLYQKYKSEATENISFTTFWRMKPFWVKQKTEKERETCLCKTCENISFMTIALYRQKAIETTKMEDLVKQVVCSTKSKDCMFGQCGKCKEQQIETNIDDQNLMITWHQWRTEKEQRTFKNGEVKEVSITKKKEEEGTVGDLSDRIHDELWMKGRKHSFIIRNQMSYYKEMKQSLQPTECLVHVDFAENYVGKMGREIQSVHFGASQNQITLHTGYYITGSMESLQSFCGVSDSLQHDPYSVWAYLNPILTDIREKHQLVDTIHFYSDGPTSQYKQKINFCLFSIETFSHGFKKATWNFHAAGHGKGIPDGIGASLKRSADQRVKYGADILNAESFIKEIQKSNSTIEVYLVREVDISEVEGEYKDESLKAVPGTTKIHQLFTENPGSIRYRDVSCVCYENPCKGHELNDFTFPISTSMKVKSQNITPNAQRTKQTGETNMRDQNEQDNECTETTREKNQNENKKNSTVGGKTNEDMFEIRRKEGKFRRLLKTLQSCLTFNEMKVQCQAISDQIGSVYGTVRSFQKFTVESISQGILPKQFSEEGDVPVKVKADGDCLPACGSVYAYGNDQHSSEMRFRIIHELTLNDDYYLDETNLLKGELPNNEKAGSLIKAFAMYSEEYMHDGPLTTDKIKDIYQKEVMKITKEKVFMGIWQIYGLSSVLQMSLRSVYPELGNPIVQRHLNRLVEPRVDSRDRAGIGQIFWTTTRLDMRNNNWIPNHFVPILPAVGETEREDDLDPSESKLREKENKKIKTLYKESLTSMKNRRTVNHIQDEEKTVDLCLGKYVLILYNGQCYPGYVEDIDFESQSVFVECMHRVGSKHVNCFSWPRKIRDRNWYELDEIVSIISQPTPVEGTISHLSVEQSEWDSAIRQLNQL